MKKIALCIALMFSCGQSDYAYEHLHREGYQLVHCNSEGSRAICTADNHLFTCVNSGVACNPDVACEPMIDRRDY